MGYSIYKRLLLLTLVVALLAGVSACARQVTPANKPGHAKVSKSSKAGQKPATPKEQPLSAEQQEVSGANSEVDEAVKEMDSLMREMDQIDAGQDNPQGI